MGAGISLAYSEIKTEKGNGHFGLLPSWIRVSFQDDQLLCLATDGAAALKQHHAALAQAGGEKQRLL